MKKYVCTLLCILLLLSLAGCAQPEDPKFYVTKYKMENSLGTNIQEMTHTYDDQWRNTRLETTVNGELIFWQDLHYSEDNKTITIDIFSNGETGVTESRQEFDKNGNVIKLETTMDGEPYTISYREYDQENRLVNNTTTFFSGMVQTTVVTHDYDSQGNLICEKAESTTEESVILSRTDYIYDSQNRCTRETQFQDDERISYTEFTYDGLVKTGRRYDTNGTYFGKMVYTYDEWGNLLTMEAYTQDGTLNYWQAYNYIGTDGTVSIGIA